MKTSEVIFVSAPYTHSDKDVVNYRMKVVTETLAQLASIGKVGISPLLMHFCLNTGIQLPSDFEFWKNYSLTLLSKSDLVMVLLLPGWAESEGVKEEINLAYELKIPVIYQDI